MVPTCLSCLLSAPPNWFPPGVMAQRTLRRCPHTNQPSAGPDKQNTVSQKAWAGAQECVFLASSRRYGGRSSGCSERSEDFRLFPSDKGNSYIGTHKMAAGPPPHPGAWAHVTSLNLRQAALNQKCVTVRKPNAPITILQLRGGWLTSPWEIGPA